MKTDNLIPAAPLDLRELAPGVQLCFTRLDAPLCPPPLDWPRLLVFDFCRSGRRAIPDGAQYAIVTEGHAAVSFAVPGADFYLPGSQYEALQLFIDPDAVQADSFLTLMGLEIGGIADYFCRGGVHCCPMSDAITAIVDEVWDDAAYAAPGELRYAAVRLLYELLRQQDMSDGPAITLFDLSSEAPQDDMFGQLVRGLPEKLRVYHAGDVLEGLDVLEKELPAGRRQFVVFFGLNRARRLLIQPDAYTQAPRERFVSLLQRGPENNMNFIVWANSTENLLSLYKDALPCFEQRLVSGIPAEQFTELTYAEAPSNMKPKNAVYFDMDSAENPKIRLYDQPTDSWVRQFVSRLQDAIRATPKDSLW